MTYVTHHSFLAWIVIGALAGWLAGLVVRGGGFGLIGDIVVGIIGAYVAAWLLPRLHVVVAHGFFGSVVDAAIGAVVLLLIFRVVRRI